MARCAWILLLSVGLWGQGAAPYDVVIYGARVVDGSGSPWFLADIGIRGDRIAAVGALGSAPANARIDARGMVVAPGFIDIHSHGRRGIAAVPTAENYLREGVTTIVEGPDGSSPLPIAAFLDGIRKMPISVNFATMVGQGSIRQAVIGPVNRKATAGGDREDERDGGAGHARRRVRPLHRPVLRTGKLHAHRGSDRTRQGGGKDGRHPHFPHARGGVARVGQRARDDPHRRGRRAADADHAPQDDRAAELGQERGVAQAGGRGAGARRGRDDRSVSVHGVEHGNRGAGAAVGAGRRAEIDRRAAGGAGPARADQGGDRAKPEGGPRRGRSEKRGDRQLRVRPLAGRQESDATDAGARGWSRRWRMPPRR